MFDKDVAVAALAGLLSNAKMMETYIAIAINSRGGGIQVGATPNEMMVLPSDIQTGITMAVNHAIIAATIFKNSTTRPVANSLPPA